VEASSWSDKTIYHCGARRFVEQHGSERRRVTDNHPGRHGVYDRYDQYWGVPDGLGHRGPACFRTRSGLLVMLGDSHAGFVWSRRGHGHARVLRARRSLARVRSGVRGRVRRVVRLWVPAGSVAVRGRRDRVDRRRGTAMDAKTPGLKTCVMPSAPASLISVADSDRRAQRTAYTCSTSGSFARSINSASTSSGWKGRPSVSSAACSILGTRSIGSSALISSPPFAA